MIPIKLHLSGFLSYQDPAALDFDGLELACISGANGAGKSSILDAITWALFGQARSRDDDALINAGHNVKAAEVIFDFGYEGNVFRVQRSKARGKATVLEFYVLGPQGDWKPLTEKSVRETEKRLNLTLRMDYDTFVNASFFLQGRADQFAQQNPANRKKVLSNVLGLEVWEIYKTQAAEQRKQLELENKALDAQIIEIEQELAQGPARKARLEESEMRLAQTGELRQAKEAALDAFRRLASSLGEQKRLVDVLADRLRETRARCDGLQSQVIDLDAARNDLVEKLAGAEETERAFADWKAARLELERWDSAAASFHEFQARRVGPLAQIASTRAQLEEERRGLALKEQACQQELKRCLQLEGQLPGVRLTVEGLQNQLKARIELEETARQFLEQVSRLEADNKQLYGDMGRLKERIDKLKLTVGADCPLCGHPMNQTEREALINTLELEGRQMGDQYRANLKIVQAAQQQQRDYQTEIARLAKQDEALRQHTRLMDQLESELARLREGLDLWNTGGAVRLGAVNGLLTGEDYCHEARTKLAEFDAAARELGYDAVGHDQARQAEQDLRTAEQALRELDAARARLEPLENQLSGVMAQLKSEQAQVEARIAEYQSADAKYQSELVSLPDLNLVEREALALRSDENRLRMETGMLRQQVAVLDTQRERKARLATQREDLNKQISRLRVLERAFGKDGVPALLIEQALPEIEEQANDILDRLSAGSMSVHFATQRKLKSKDETRETLDIIISDRSGEREYEMFSGGEAFRVNFAIRLALSRVLAHRAGARLQTLFIDEGFGSQDAEGRQRLLEAINQVKPEFERILVITHLEEMKDAFPSRIEVEKTSSGSQVRVLR